MNNKDNKYYQSKIEIEADQKDEVSGYFLNEGASSVAETEINDATVTLIITHQNKTLVTDIAPQAKVEKLNLELQYNWLENYDGFYLGKSFYIQPSHKESPKDIKIGITTIAVDPKDAFGDGRHPTTELCVTLLESVLENKKETSCCDVGTGTGLLAIVAEKLGLKEIDAFDICKVSVKNAKKNTTQNNCTNINCFEENIETFTPNKKYDVVIANLLTEIIESNIQNLINLMEPKGLLIISGIGKQWKETIEIIFLKHNLKIQKAKEKSSWMAYQLSK
jgi:ribosomal protein L11 methyltransferase